MKHQPCSASAPNQVPVEESGDRSPASARQPMQTVPHQQPADTACDSLLLLHQQGSHAKRTPSPEDAQAPGSIDEANKSIGKLLDSWAGLEDGQAGKVREVQDSKDEKEPSAPKQSRRLTFDSTADQPAMVQTTSSDRQQAAAANLTACEHGQQLSQEPDAAMVLDTEVAEACNDTGVGSLLPSSSRERTEAPELEGLMEAEGKMQEAHEHVPGGYDLAQVGQMQWLIKSNTAVPCTFQERHGSPGCSGQCISMLMHRECALFYQPACRLLSWNAI